MRPLHGIILHCSATRPEWMAGHSTFAKVQEIKRWHVDGNGWSDIGYHFVIDRDGSVVKGRPMTRNGAHVKGHNTGTIGICLLGGYGSNEKDAFSDHFTPEQDKAVRELIGELRDTYGALTLTGHNVYAAKACPGFSVAKWWAGTTSVQPISHPDPAEQGNWFTRWIGIIMDIRARLTK